MDSVFVLGSAAAGYLFLLFHLILHVPVSFLWWFWSIGFDGTHIFATASRTYFDREARLRDRRLLFGSLAFFFLLGPALVLAGAKAVMYMLVAVWAYYHVCRQHYGFLVLYKVKNHDLVPLDHTLDRIFLAVMLVAPPFHRFFIHHPEELGMRASLASIEPAMWALVAAAALAWTGRQAWLVRAGHSLAVPKYLLLAGIVPLHWLTFAFLSWQAAVPTVTIVHNLQYHAIVWFHNRNRYGSPDASRLHGRIPFAVTRSLAAYAVLGLAFSVMYRVPGFALGRVSDLAFGFFSGFGLTHYFLDSRIWRVRHDPALRRVLGLA